MIQVESYKELSLYFRCIPTCQEVKTLQKLKQVEVGRLLSQQSRLSWKQSLTKAMVLGLKVSLSSSTEQIQPKLETMSRAQ